MEFMQDIFEKIVLYICHAAPKNKLGTVKLNKILWFFETTCFLQFGELVTGETFIKRERGPVAQHFYATICKLEAEAKLKIIKPGDYEPTEYICKKKPALPLNVEKLAILDMLINNICYEHTSVTISRKSHDRVWHETEMGQPMNIAAYCRTPVKVTPRLRTWAEQAASGVQDQAQG